MDIKYLGHSSFLLSGKQGKVVLDPFDSTMLGGKFPNVEANIITLSHDHGDHNAVSAVKPAGATQPLVFDIPGEYESHGIRIYGFDTFHDKKKGEERGRNVMFKIVIDDISILHCGDLGHALSAEIVDDIDGVDVVMIPVGGHFTINADEARQVVEKLEPSVVIPMHYKDADFKPEIMDLLAPVDDFLEKLGASAVAPVTKYTPVKADFTGEELTVVLMEKI